MIKAKIDVDIELRKKIEDFLEKLETWRKEQEYLSLDEFIWKLYTDTGYYHYVGLMPNGLLRQANLKMLFERAKQYETASFKGLYNFIHFIERLKLSNGDLGAAKLIGENDNVIRIMSIHKSKGLEFPVVFLASTGKQFNLMDLNKSILLHQDMGIGAKYIDYDKQVEYDTLTKAAIRSKMLTETLSEEMRILYVALTRAKEKLIITGISKDFKKEIEEIEKQRNQYKKIGNKINHILLKKYKRYLDWILLVYCYESEKIKEFAELTVKSKKEQLKEFEKVEKEKIEVNKQLEEAKIDQNQVNIITEKLEYEYPYKQSITIPTKTSVTKIKQMELENNNLDLISNNTKHVIEKEYEQEPKDQREEKFPKPKFLRNQEEQKITSAQKGTLIHMCIQRLDEKRDYTIKDIENHIQNLKEKHIFTYQKAEAINTYKILEYTKSKIWKELKEAKEIQKEKPFYINIPANEIYKNTNDKEDKEKQQKDENQLEEKILVQGIIDLYYINEQDQLILVDYKTDYVEPGKEQDLINKYQKQLELYKQTLESAKHKKVYKTYIYSVYLGKELVIE